MKLVMKLMYKNEEATGKVLKVLPKRYFRLLKINYSVETVWHKSGRFKGFAFPSPIGVHLPFLAQILLWLNNFTGQDFICEGEMVVAGSPMA